MTKVFWLLCGLWCGLGNGAFIWLRRSKYMKLGLSEGEVASFAKGTVLWILIPSLFLWGLQLSAGADLPPHYWRWPAPQKQAAIGLQILMLLALAYWVFIRDGAETLSACARVGSRRESILHSPTAMKLGTAIALIAGTVALLKGSP